MPARRSAPEVPVAAEAFRLELLTTTISGLMARPWPIITSVLWAGSVVMRALAPLSQPMTHAGYVCPVGARAVSQAGGDTDRSIVILWPAFRGTLDRSPARRYGRCHPQRRIPP